MILCDNDGRIFSLNRSAEEMLGIARRRAMGEPLRSHLSQPELLKFWYAAVDGEEPASAEITLGTGVLVRATVSTCHSSTGATIGRALLVRDVTREKKIQIELSTSLARRLVELAGSEEEPAPELASLTAREREVLLLLAEGLSNAGIASRLHVSSNTVASHLKHLFRKIRVTSRVHAAAFAITHKTSLRRYDPDHPVE